jgi:tRNA uridine 5-carbamoylmethylation protein Kti12
MMESVQMKVINLFGGPGVGKSTAASGLFYEMKKLGMNVELVQEYAKDVVYEKRYNLLDDQLYILAKQSRRIARLEAHGIEWVVSDSPVALGLVYLKDGVFSEAFPNLVIEVFSHYTNFNYLLQRHFKYNPIGRNQSDVEEAKIFDEKVKTLLTKYQLPFEVILGGESAVDKIMKDITLQ